MRVAVLTGAGGTFCAGMDLKAAAPGSSPLTERRGPLGITALPIAKPLIAAVEGHALAGGCELALIADLVVASDRVAVRDPRAQARPGRRGGRGDAADASGCRATSRWSWPSPATRCRPTRLAELGLVNRLAEPGDVLDAALALAEEIVANAPLSVQVSRRIVAESPTWAPEEAFSRQSDLASVAVTSEDAAEGIAAFAEHRAPVWRGR